LDIELNSNLSGINIANKIREDDWESEIIFLTNHDNMFEQVYRSIYKVFNFIEKYHNFEERLSKDLAKIVNKNYDNKCLNSAIKK
jgi:oligoendopeptidase F